MTTCTYYGSHDGCSRRRVRHSYNKHLARTVTGKGNNGKRRTCTFKDEKENCPWFKKCESVTMRKWFIKDDVTK